MKFIYVLLVLSLFVKADEIERIESLVSDIQQLRINYDNAQESLSLKTRLLEDEKQKNKILLNELEKREIEIENMENQLKNIKSIEKSNKNNNSKTKEKKLIYLENKENEKNVFPQLQMRNSTMQVTTKKVTDITPQTYRINKNANVYDAIDGQVVREWEKRTSFTSNYKEGEWIKVTGYFVQRVWQKAEQELWVHTNDADKR